MFDLAMNALGELPREQAIEYAIAYNKMKETMAEFLEPYIESGKVVTKDEVMEFFEVNII